MKLYTKTGDSGQTSLVYGKRVSKHSPMVHAYGTCDEANSMIGLAMSALGPGEEWTSFRQVMHVVQTKLFHAGAELATPPLMKVAWPLTEADVKFLEEHIDEMDAALPPLTQFVLPGGHPCGAALHVARTIVRRAERMAAQVWKEENINPLVLAYLNRLSDLLFVAARYVNHREGCSEPELHQDRT
ncbi:cob(I)yrinic acid a,c-diamide adenosyltransferase [Paenibacillus sacheonensis]|uniref:Corrinoid adenosyltransferase n=1 Tax=Paenibacillus sacheonensis TaxID=742054 RepID=A0A7X4YMK7_9BACL|nr:cob(I)yrinic acid a,c-diamide adenosyltransferase [Paenibacillus sacheonensis]MBM7563085.1 cob(I)alamin adenosyltransferase [Paenibacillus sacheonensis]NBC68346.1 cob(I)yrinic acid a,c-diamide adenosyltransferase [Paenibacillus sacheonensis]